MRDECVSSQRVNSVSGAASVALYRLVLEELDEEFGTFRRLFKRRQMTALRQDMEMRVRQCVGERLAHGDRHDLVRRPPQYQRWHAQRAKPGRHLGPRS